MYGGNPYGSATYCEISGANGARSSPITALIAGVIHKLLTYLLWLRPYDPQTLSNVDLYIGGGWYRTGGSDTFPTGETGSHLLFHGILISPPNIETRIMSNGELYHGSSTLGDFTISDARRDYSEWLRYSWKNASCRYFIGDGESWPLSSFAEVFRGVTTSLSAPSPGRMTIAIDDVVSKLQSRTYQQNKYTGRGPCIRLDGATGYLSGTVSCPANSITIRMWVRPRTSTITSAQSVVGWKSGAAAGERRLRLDNSKAAVFGVRNDGGTLYEATSANNVVSLNTWIDLVGVLDVDNGVIILYDGSNPDVPLATLAVAGTFATILTTFTAGRQPDSSAQFLNADIDQIDIWNKALSTVEIKKWHGQRPPVGTTNLIFQYSMTEATGSTTYESAGAGPNLTLNAYSTGSTWVDSLTGGAELQGKYIPRGRGIARQCPLQALVTGPDLIYQIAESFDHLDSLQDGGSAVWTLIGTYTDPWAATPTTGQYIEIPTMGLIRLGSKPTKQMTCDVYLTAATDLPSFVTGITLTDGALSSDEVDQASIASLPATRGIGYLSGTDPVTVDDVLLKALDSIFGYRTPDDVGALSVGVVNPPETLTATGTATGSDFGIDGVTPAGTLLAARSVTVNYRPYYVQQDYTNTSTLLTESQRQDLGKAYRSFSTPDDLTIPSVNPAAKELDTLLDSVLDAQDLAVRLSTWRSVDRRTDILVYSDPIPKFQKGQIVRITMAALDYDGGKNVTVVATFQDDSQGRYGCEVIGAVVIQSVILLGPGTQLDIGDGTGVILTGEV